MTAVTPKGTAAVEEPLRPPCRRRLGRVRTPSSRDDLRAARASKTDAITALAVPGVAFSSSGAYGTECTNELPRWIYYCYPIDWLNCTAGPGLFSATGAQRLVASRSHSGTRNGADALQVQLDACARTRPQPRAPGAKDADVRTGSDRQGTRLRSGRVLRNLSGDPICIARASPG